MSRSDVFFRNILGLFTLSLRDASLLSQTPFSISVLNNRNGWSVMKKGLGFIDVFCIAAGAMIRIPADQPLQGHETARGNSWLQPA
ncbi:hypothetical protein [Pontiella sp.]|uniref:hypothetical protein n=1 Tax=Pontiella sp. TaxID=2837462 RepID=UPI003561CD9D